MVLNGDLTDSHKKNKQTKNNALTSVNKAETHGI